MFVKLWNIVEYVGQYEYSPVNPKLKISKNNFTYKSIYKDKSKNVPEIIPVPSHAVPVKKMIPYPEQYSEPCSYGMEWFISTIEAEDFNICDTLKGHHKNDVKLVLLHLNCPMQWTPFWEKHKTQVPATNDWAWVTYVFGHEKTFFILKSSICVVTKKMSFEGDIYVD